MKPAIWWLPALVTLAANCANLPYNTPGQIPGTSNPGTDPGSTIPNPRSSASQAGSKEVCRGSAMPRGWIAVDYISGSATCRSSMRDDGANTAVIVRYETLPPDAILVVCADQHIPYKWDREPEEPSDAASGQCPRRGGDTRSGPPIVRIRRTGQ
jgi:hypothetical protein